MNELRRGVFWVTDIESVDMITVSARCDINGNFLEKVNTEFLTDNGAEFNHKCVWKALRKNKSYNYYPRGRVQIKHCNAVIYCSPLLCNETIISKIVNVFGLLTDNGIVYVRVIADGSEHYRCLSVEH